LDADDLQSCAKVTKSWNQVIMSVERFKQQVKLISTMEGLSLAKKWSAQLYWEVDPSNGALKRFHKSLPKVWQAAPQLD